MIEITRTDSNDTCFKNLIRELDNDLSALYHNKDYRYDLNINVDELETVVVAKIEDIAVGCGCFKEIAPDIVEIKRLYVNPYFRSFGVATAVLSELLEWLRELNYSKALLETGKKQPEAINFFKKHGFVETELFGSYIGSSSSYCMEKEIG